MRKNLLLLLFVLLNFAVHPENSTSVITKDDKTRKDSINASITGIAADSIDIRQMVIAQIEAARAKQTQDSLAALQNNNIQKDTVKAVAAAPVAVTLKPRIEKTQLEKISSYIESIFQAVKIPNELMIKISVLGTVAFFSFLFVFIRRRRLNAKKAVKRDIKDGIKLLREEKVRVKKDSKLSQVRNKLLGSTFSFQLSKESVTKNARELNIAKGEIYLAARIKSHELKKASY